MNHLRYFVLTYLVFHNQSNHTDFGMSLVSLQENQESSINSSAGCAICLERVIKNINYIITECKHEFHASCMLEYVYRNRFHNKCPICRFELCKLPTNPHEYFTNPRNPIGPNGANIDFTDTVNIGIVINYLMLVIKLVSMIAVVLWVIYTIQPNVTDIIIKTTLLYFTPKVLNMLLDITKCLLITTITFVAFINTLRTLR